jgi:hypothetical protein
VPIRSLAVMAALAKWADFPVHREPRPIVPIDIDRFDIGIDDWPEAVTTPAAEEDLPASLLPAALDYCKGLPLPPGRRLAPLLRGEGPIGTDRGVRLVPAWMMFRDDRRTPFIAIDPEFERNRTWRPPGLRVTGDPSVSLAADGRTLSYGFTAHPGFDYPGAKVHQMATAVVVEPVGIRRRHVSLDYMSHREMTLRLDAPLGNRVLIAPGPSPDSDFCGAPILVRTQQHNAPR